MQERIYTKQYIGCPDAILHTVHNYKSVCIPYNAIKDSLCRFCVYDILLNTEAFLEVNGRMKLKRKIKLDVIKPGMTWSSSSSPGGVTDASSNSTARGRDVLGSSKL